MFPIYPPLFNIPDKYTDILYMTGLTLSEIAKELGINRDAVEKRLRKSGIKPICREVLYDPSVIEIEAVRNVQMGRPRKKKE
jgi:predicted DNA-binding protein YlxM (UPF0122 family)